MSRPTPTPDAPPAPGQAIAEWQGEGTSQVITYYIKIDRVTRGRLYHWRHGDHRWTLTTPASGRAAHAPVWASEKAALAALSAYWPQRPPGAPSDLTPADWPALREVTV